MHRHFLISTTELNADEIPDKMHLLFNNEILYFYSTPGSYYEDTNVKVFYDGYILPRLGETDNFNFNSETDHILNGLAVYGCKFIEKIKGIFFIIICYADKAFLYTDHFGLYRFFYCSCRQNITISNNFNILAKLCDTIIPDSSSLLMRCLFHRNINGVTSFKNIYQSIPATSFEISSEGLIKNKYWETSLLLEDNLNPGRNLEFSDFAELLQQNFNLLNSCLKPDNHAITLTGGKDSRTGLATLLSMGINPFGFTYGDPDSKDAVYAKKISEVVPIKHYVYKPPDTSEWFDLITREIIRSGNPEISINRAHRLFSFKEMSALTGEKTAFYPGYMAGEFLMGIYYDDLIFTRFMTNFWDSSTLDPIDEKLNEYYHRFNYHEIDEIKEKIFQLGILKKGFSIKEKQFYGMFEIGIPHHYQDVFLAGLYFNYVYPFFIDIDFLEALFKSRFSFLNTDNNSINPFKRYKLYEFNLNIQHMLFPELDKIPFGKKGSYNTEEFLKGRVYWTLAKSFRYIFQHKKYPVNYTYGPVYRNFLAGVLTKLELDRNNIIHEYFDVARALSDLFKINGYTGEKDIKKFADIVMLYLQFDALQNEI